MIILKKNLLKLILGQNNILLKYRRSDLHSIFNDVFLHCSTLNTDYQCCTVSTVYRFSKQLLQIYFKLILKVCQLSYVLAHATFFGGMQTSVLTKTSLSYPYYDLRAGATIALKRCEILPLSCRARMSQIMSSAARSCCVLQMSASQSRLVISWLVALRLLSLTVPRNSLRISEFPVTVSRCY